MTVGRHEALATKRLKWLKRLKRLKILADVDACVMFVDQSSGIGDLRRVSKKDGLSSNHTRSLMDHE
jgi:hypothetical protein